MPDSLDTIENVIRCLHDGTTGSNVSEASSQAAIPKGWHKFLQQIYRLTNLLECCTIQSVGIEKGLLRVKGVSTSDLDQKLFNRVVHSIARDSATTCMACGQYAFRRKEEADWPALCKIHYVEYVNFLDTLE